MTTIKQLLAVAKSLGIKGRHEMTKAQLENALDLGAPTNPCDLTVVTEAPVEQPTEASVEQPTPAPVETAKVPAGNISGKTFWRAKLYYVDRAMFDTVVADGTLAKAPAQVQLMLKSMVARDVTSSLRAERGGVAAQAAISGGFLATKTEPAVLFAYYRARMETLGLVYGL